MLELKTGDTFDTYWSVLKDFKANSKTCNFFENYHQEPQDEHIQKITDQKNQIIGLIFQSAPKKLTLAEIHEKGGKTWEGLNFAT